METTTYCLTNMVLIWYTNHVIINDIIIYYQGKDANKSFNLRKHYVIGVSNELNHNANDVLKFRERLEDLCNGGWLCISILTENYICQRKQYF